MCGKNLLLSQLLTTHAAGPTIAVCVSCLAHVKVKYPAKTFRQLRLRKERMVSHLGCASGKVL